MAQLLKQHGLNLNQDDNGHFFVVDDKQKTIVPPIYRAIYYTDSFLICKKDIKTLFGEHLYGKNEAEEAIMFLSKILKVTGIQSKFYASRLNYHQYIECFTNEEFRKIFESYMNNLSFIIDVYDCEYIDFIGKYADYNINRLVYSDIDSLPEGYDSSSYLFDIIDFNGNILFGNCLNCEASKYESYDIFQSYHDDKNGSYVDCKTLSIELLEGICGYIIIYCIDSLDNVIDEYNYGILYKRNPLIIDNYGNILKDEMGH